jgi:multiple sugar transport system permease protein
MGMGLVSIIPMLIVFIFFQRYFIQGIANTGLK